MDQLTIVFCPILVIVYAGFVPFFSSLSINQSLILKLHALLYFCFSLFYWTNISRLINLNFFLVWDFLVCSSFPEKQSAKREKWGEVSCLTVAWHLVMQVEHRRRKASTRSYGRRVLGRWWTCRRPGPMLSTSLKATANRYIKRMNSSLHVLFPLIGLLNNLLE